MVRILSKNRFNYSFLFWFILLTLNFPFFFNLDASAATQVSLEWAPNSEPDLAGYRVFYREQGQSYDYSNPSWEGTNTYSTIYDLDETKTYCFVKRAFDTEGFESENSVEVCHETLIVPNQAPTADAGPDQTVSEGQTVLLSGSNSTDPDDGIASYHWVQIGEPVVDLSDPDVSQPTFTALVMGPEGAALTVELTVIDYNGNQGKDVCTVNVTWQNEPPQADAGTDQTVVEGIIVTLNGSSSLDIDDGIASYLWTQVDGDPVSLSDPTSAVTTFTTPKTELLGKNIKLKLTVKDHGGLQGTSDSSIYVMQNELSNTPLVADFRYTTKRTNVSFTDQSTDSDGTIVSWFWDFGDGKTSTEKNPRHSYIGYGTYAVMLTVADDVGARNSQSKTVTFTTKTRRGKR